jgi:hypothetical protein
MVTAVLAAVSDLAAYPLELAAWLHKLTRDDHIAFACDAAYPTTGSFGCRRDWRVLISRSRSSGGGQQMRNGLK